MSAVPVNLWDEADRRVGLDEPPGPRVNLPIQARRRRNYTPALQDPRAKLHLVDALYVNVYDVVNSRYIVLSQDALQRLTEALES